MDILQLVRFLMVVLAITALYPSFRLTQKFYTQRPTVPNFDRDTNSLMLFLFSFSFMICATTGFISWVLFLQTAGHPINVPRWMYLWQDLAILAGFNTTAWATYLISKNGATIEE